MNALSISSETKSLIAAGTVGALSAYAFGPANIWSISRLAIGALSGSIAYGIHSSLQEYTHMPRALSGLVSLANGAGCTGIIFNVWSQGSYFTRAAAIYGAGSMFGLYDCIAQQLGSKKAVEAARIRRENNGG